MCQFSQRYLVAPYHIGLLLSIFQTRRLPWEVVESGGLWQHELGSHTWLPAHCCLGPSSCPLVGNSQSLDVLRNLEGGIHREKVLGVILQNRTAPSSWFWLRVKAVCSQAMGQNDLQGSRVHRWPLRIYTIFSW